jgi:O-antigen ligase
LKTNDQIPVPQPKQGFFGRLVGLIDGSYVDRSACDAAFERMHRQDAIGDRIHLVFAFLGIVCLFGPVTLTEIAFGPLTVFFVVRIKNTFPVWVHGFGQPAGLVVIVMSVWMMLSLRWSGDPSLGWGEIAELRWFVLLGLIFPVIEQRLALIAAMCIGLAIGQLGQMLDVFDGFGIGTIANLVENHPGRVSGWWHPVVGGSLLVGALGLHLPAALYGEGRSRVFGVLGSIVVGVGIIATGTRGAWIAAALLIAFVVLFAAITKRIRWRSVLLCSVVACIVAVVAGFAMRGAIQTRIDETRTELAEIADGQYDSYTGLRVRMAQLAVDAGFEHPIIGVGAGGYQQWSLHQDPDSGAHAHAHNSLLQVLSTLGIVGVLIWGGVIIVLIRGAWRIWDKDTEGAYGSAPMFAIIGLMLASFTDSIQINTQTAAMFATLAALCPAYRPRLSSKTAREE